MEFVRCCKFKGGKKASPVMKYVYVYVLRKHPFCSTQKKKGNIPFGMCRYHWARCPSEVYCCQSNLWCTGNNIDSDHAINSSYACTVSFVPLTSTVINPILFPEIIHIFQLRWLFSSDIQTVRFKNELERNITIKLGYANAKIYKCEDDKCPRPMCYKSVS